MVEDSTERCSERLEITTFSDDAKRQVDVRGSEIVPSTIANPYFTETILQFISRPYPVGNFSWTESANIGDRIYQLKMPDNLFNIKAIWDKIRNFNFFRAGIRIGVRVNGTKFHYGKLLINWVPQGRLDTQIYRDATDNLYSASGCPFIIVSPTENEVREFVMPFCVPFNYINLKQFCEQGSTRNARLMNIGNVNIYVLNPLRLDDEAVPPVDITLFANFESPELAGYTVEDSLEPPPVVQDVQFAPLGVLALPEIPPVPNNMPTTQMLGGAALLSEAAVPLLGSAVPEVAEATGLGSVASGLGTASSVLGAAAAVTSALHPSSSDSPVDDATAIGGTIHNGDATPPGHDSNPDQSRDTTQVVPYRYPSFELNNLSSIRSWLQKISNASNVFTPLKGVGDYAKILSRVTGMGANAIKALGYSTPLTHNPLSMFKLHQPLLSLTRQPLQAISLGTIQDNAVSAVYDILGSFPEEQSLLHLMTTPSLLGIREIIPTTEIVYSIPVAPNVAPIIQANEIMPTVLSFTTAPFAYWRGSMKYILQITGSAFHSARIQILWEPTSTVPNFVTAFNAVSHIMDIQEETTICFSVPYLATLPYLQNGSIGNVDYAAERAGYNGSLHIRVVNSLTHKTSPVPPIYANLWVMGGEDLQFAQIQNYNITTQVGPAFAQSSRDEMRSMKAMSLIPAVNAIMGDCLMGESITSIKQVYKRPVVLQPDVEDFYSFTLFGPWTARNQEDAFLPGFIDYYRMLFRYSRGSFIIRSQDSFNNTERKERFAYIFPWNAGTLASQYSAFVPDVSRRGFLNMPQGGYYSPDLEKQPLEVMVPFFADQFAYVNMLGEVLVFNSVPMVHLESPVAGFAYDTVMPGDDYDLLFQIGPPRLVFKSLPP